MNRSRIRQLGITPGVYPTGPYNAITDVPGVLVGHVTVIHDDPDIARTGITALPPGMVQ
jgi:D-aminopeptidase